MKKRLLICFLALYSVSSFAQNKATLTKEETIDYINRKLQEPVSHYRSIDGKKNYLWDQYFELHNESIKTGHLRSTYSSRQNPTQLQVEGYYGSVYTYPCDYSIVNKYFVFNPAHIKTITLDNTNVSGEPIGVIAIRLIANTGKRIATATETTKKGLGYCAELDVTEEINDTVDIIYIYFLQSDPTSYNKIKKALEYLRDLCKAEDDPFGE